MEQEEKLKGYSGRYIIIKGAKVHNLKNIDLSIPRKSLTVITGLSGSGKSSLAFDTIFAEGQRRYVESLSAYARQFLGRINKPDVEYIKGLSPAIAVEQKVNNRNPRSTVGTTTEIYDYIKLLYARVGITYSPVSGQEVKRDTVSDVIDFIKVIDKEERYVIYCSVFLKKGRTLEESLNILKQQGFSNVFSDNQILNIDDVIKKKKKDKKIDLVIDRFVGGRIDDESLRRLADSVQTAFYEGEGRCLVRIFKSNGEYTDKEFINRYEMDGIEFEEPSVNLFTFNNPYGACRHCEGFGSVIGIDEDLVIPDKNLSVFEDAVFCWRGEKLSEWKTNFVMKAYKYEFPIHKPYYELSNEQKELLWAGNNEIEGINAFFKFIEANNYKIQYRVLYSRYRGKTVCPECKGNKLRKEANYVKVGGKNIAELVKMSVFDLLNFFKKIELDEHRLNIAQRLLKEIIQRLEYLNEVGLGYLTLERGANTLSGGEAQRINLATALGSNLTGSIYILDEPSIGLHQRDIDRLVKVLINLRDLGNTVIVVEHEEAVIRAADYIVDIGPGAGINGGEVVFSGKLQELLFGAKTLTGDYLQKIKEIEIPAKRRSWKEYIEIKGARENNLKNIDVIFPLNIFTVVTGVSGSGKTTLVKHILYNALKKIYEEQAEKSGLYASIEMDKRRLAGVEFVDQNPIGRSTRSNPATYIKAYDDIRELFASERLSKIRGYKAGYFSFNIAGGRCEECEGEGLVKISMQFIADVELVCDSCGGQRFKKEVLEVKFKGKNINDVLNLSIDEAVDFFSEGKALNTIESRLINKLKILQDVGLGYLQLGQSSSTMSGGEAQRIKLAYFLVKGNAEKPFLFIFDEPTRGLHFEDINNLLKALNALIDKGHSLLIIEHNPELIKNADWLIDLGPEGGEAGGHLVFAGKPEDLVKDEKVFSYTGKYLRKIMKS